jgi:hypothetical protein
MGRIRSLLVQALSAPTSVEIALWIARCPSCLLGGLGSESAPRNSAVWTLIVHCGMYSVRRTNRFGVDVEF